MDTQGATMFNMGQVQALPVTFQHIQKATRRDMILSKVFCYVIEGWPNHVPGELKPYKNRETELSTENGCLMWGNLSDSSSAITVTSSADSSCQSPRNHLDESNCSELLLLVEWIG